MPRFLVVTKEYSDTPTSGGMLRTRAIVDQLADVGDVVVVSPQGTFRREAGQAVPPDQPPAGDERPWWRLVGTYKSISGARLGQATVLTQLERLSPQRYDAAIIDHTCMVGLAARVERLADRVIVSTHNIESDLMAQRADAAAFPKKVPLATEVQLLKRLERTAARRYPVVVVSTADAAALESGARAVVCPNGVFTDQIGLGGEPAAPHSMLFIGALDWEPNTEGLFWFLEGGWQRVRDQVPDATFTIAGRNPTPEVLRLGTLPGVTIAASPPSMQEFLKPGTVGVVPLLTGGGSRIKILEYLAAGLDVVSTTVGAAGLDDIPAGFIDRLADADYTDGLIRRLQDPRDNSRTAPEWIRNHYSWDITLEPMRKLLES